MAAKRSSADKAPKTVGPAAPAIILGWREWVTLPDFTSTPVKAKIDTGARSSAIHAWQIKPFERDGVEWVSFELHPVQDDNRTKVSCEARVLDSRLVRSSTGHQQRRYVIETRLVVGGETWPIELTLTRRDEMGFRMLIGRTALRPGALVNPSKSFLWPLKRSSR